MSNLLNKLPSRFTVNLMQTDDPYLYNYVYGTHLVKLFYNAEDGSIDISIGGFSAAVNELDAKYWIDKELTLDLLQEKIEQLVYSMELSSFSNNWRG